MRFMTKRSLIFTITENKIRWMQEELHCVSDILDGLFKEQWAGSGCVPHQ